MASKRFHKYQWRLFFPIVGMMWFLIIVLAVYQYNREVTYRTETIHKQLALINNRIIDAYEQDISLVPFMNFLGRYFDNSVLDEMSVSVYDRDGNLIYNIGTPPLKHINGSDDIEGVSNPSEGEAIKGLKEADKGMFYYTVRKSADGKILVHTAMPYTMSITEAISAEQDMWILMLAIAIIVTVMVYYATSYLSRNIGMLRDFATYAASDGQFKIDENKFPHDELGDISRQIVKLWREKDAALQASNHEHEVALHAVEEKARIKRQLTNNINHELKTPVGVIRGYLDSLVNTPDLDEATKDRFISRARENVERLCSLLEDVSSITRLEDGSSNIPLSEINFHDLCYSVSSDLITAGMLPENVSFEFDIPLECKVRGNQGLLLGMIENLAKNALKYSHCTEFGVHMIAESERYYTFSFYDNGTGVGEEHIPRLFDRFYRVDTGRSRKVGGTGLGLPIVKSTVEALGGTITVRNRSTGGLEFFFTLEKWK
ncbi:MAG: HAMP domain-containing histidine kinase [Paramuribaculum sp.]|nr:HAMP domain-containing histidine kinase [Bacteroidales bacterium]MDE7449790.1 HAMP domain-containing histidine kinase [Paramuribaculum sp.]